MRKLFLSTLTSVLLLSGSISAQLTGVLNIPGSYPTLDAAILDLNTQGVGAGGVTLNLLAAETAPANGYTITATGTAGNPITLMGNGNTITAAASPAVGSRSDAIFRLIGSDYVTIQGFAMIENPSNTVGGALAVQQMTEFGVALFAATATDGAQNNTIQANTITLAASYQNAIGIFSTSSSSSTNGVLAATATSGTNSNNKFYGNVISGVAFGMYFICEPITATIFETGIDIGGSAAITGNQITFGNNTASDIGWTRFSSTVNGGIIFRNGAGNSARFNTINTVTGNTAAIAGIAISSGTTPTGVTYTSTFSNNTIALTNVGTTAMTGIDFGHGITNGTIVGSNNNITLTQTATAATSAAITGIKANYTNATSTCSGNTIVFNQSETTGALSSTTIGITQAGTSTTITSSLNNITINQSGSGTGTITGTTTAINVNGTSTTNDVLTNTILFNQTTSVASGITNSFTGISATSSATTLNITTNNAITVQQAVTGAGTYGTGSITYVSMNAGHTTVNINNNNFNTTSSTIRSTGDLNCILGGGTTLNGLLTIKNNTATIDRVANAGNVGFFTQTSTAPNGPADSISVNNIVFTNLATSGTVTVINRIGGSTTCVRNVCNNTISVSGTNTGAVIGIASGYSNPSLIANNSITVNCAATAVTGLSVNVSGSALNATIRGNTLSLTSSSTAPTAMSGIVMGSSSTSGSATITLNTFTGLSLTGVITSSPSVVGISAAVASTISNNIVRNITVGAAGSTGAPTVDGILVSAGGTSNIASNKIYGIATEGTGAATIVNGIRLNGGTTVNVSNNLIGVLTAPSVSSNDAIRGISITSTTTSATYNVYYNTVHINASSVGANFGTTGIFHTVSATATTATLNLRNNLVVNLSTPAGTGTTVAYRRSGTALNNYANTSNNNSFYAGTPSATRLIFSDGTNFDQTLTAYQARVAPRDASSLSENPTFMSLSGASASFLHIAAATASLLESGGAVIASFTTDYDNDARPGPVGSVNGGAIAPDIGADEFDGVLLVCTGTPTAGTSSGSPASVCGSGTFTLSATGASSGPGITYQWQSSTVSGGPYTNVPSATTLTFTTGSISTTTYYVLVVTCTNSGQSVTSSQVTATVNPNPVVTVTPTTGSICTTGGTPVTLTASGATTYTWLPTTGLTPTSGSPVSANPTASTTYTVTGTDANGCTGTATAAITLVETPVAPTVTATPASVCNNGSSQLLATSSIASFYSAPTTVAFAPINSGTGTTVLCNATVVTTPLTAGSLDDGYWNGITLPFTFTFYGTNFNSISVQTNGAVSLVPFTTTTGYNVTMPNTATPNNLIAACFGDLDWRFGNGVISCYTSGTAPNRVFVINYNGNTGGGFYNGGVAPTVFVNTQVQLFETSNIIQIHSANISGVTTVNHAQGLENATGSLGQVVPGRNNSATWTATNDAVQFAPAVLTYAWTPSTFLNNPAIANPLASNITATTTYSVTASNGGCASATGTVTVTAGSALTSTNSATPGNTVCSGTNVTLDVTPAGGGLPYTYAWSGPNSFASTLQNPVITGATTAASGTYTIIVTDACGATSTTSVTLTVNPLPTVAVTPTTALYCNPGAPITLSATGATTYSWGPAAGLSATTGASVDASPAVTTVYTVSGTDVNGCVGTATTTITSAPAVNNAVATSTPGTICVGSSTTLAVTADPVTATILTENFNSGAPAWTRTNASTGGTPANAAWTDRPDGFVYAAGTPYHSNDNSQFVQTNSDAQGSGSTTRTAIQSPAFSTLGFSNITVDFYHYYRDINDAGDSAIVETSLDAITWTMVTNYSASAGSEAAFAHATVTLPSAVDNQPTVYVRFRYKATWDWYWSIDNVSILGSGQNFTYSWTSAPVGFTSTAQSPTAAPTANTTYSVVISHAGGCSSSAVTSVTVNPLPIVTLSGSTSFCAGDSTQLTGTGGGTSQWYLNGAPIVGATSNTYYATAAGVYNMTKTNTNGCSDSAATGITIVVNPLPTVVANATATTICNGDAVTLTGSGATSYTWAAAISVTDNVAFNPSATDTYTVTGTDGNGCMNTDMITVTVNPLPTVVANATATAVCDGSPVTLSGSGATTYSWTGSVTDNVAFTPLTTDTYTVTGTDGNGCMNTDMITVTVNPLPTVVANATATTICNGDAVTLTGSGATTYTWAAAIAVTDNVAFNPSATDTYTVTGTDGNGCTDTDMITVNVNALPVVTVSFIMDTVCLNGGLFALTGETPTGGTWSGPGVSGSSFDPIVAGLGWHQVTYSYTDANSCTGTTTDSLNVDVCGGVIPVTFVNDVTIYPNPNEGQFTIQLSAVPTSSVQVEVTNELGQLISAFTMTGTTKEVNISTLEGGVYFVRVINEGNVSVHRVVKQ